MKETAWRCRAIIDCSAWRHNLSQIKKLHPEKKVMAVVKADAYGHGLLHAVNTIAEMADAIAVATIEEAILVRQRHAQIRVCLLSQCWDVEQVALCSDYQIELVIWMPEHLDWLSHLPQHQSVGVWLKVDTGMGRLGLLPEQTASALDMLNTMANVQLCGVMTHFANADDMQDDYTKSQIARFKSLNLPAQMPVSLANSAAALGDVYESTLNSIKADEHWIRPGLMLTGASPFVDDAHRLILNRQAMLKPVMTVQARLLGVRKLKAGSPIGYGGHYITPCDMPVGIVSIGYGDGYPRGVDEHNACVVIHDKKARIIGRISMDSLCIDLRDIDSAKVGDEVTMWGAKLPIEQVAKWAKTIPYEIMCQLTPRVPRVLINAGKEKG